MSTDLDLYGLDVTSPIGFLAAIGVTQLLGAATTLRWSGTGLEPAHAVLGTASTADVATLGEVLADRIATTPLRGLSADATDLNKVTPAILRGVLERDPPHARLLAALCAEAPARRDGMAPRSPLCLVSFRGRRNLFGTVAREESSARASSIQRVLEGPWAYASGTNTLNLDPGARAQDGARMGPDPSLDGTRGVPGLLPLALHGLACLPPMPRPPQPTGGAVQRTRFCWPEWRHPFPAAHVPRLVARDWSARTIAERGAAGLVAVHASDVSRGREDSRLAVSRPMP